MQKVNNLLKTYNTNWIRVITGPMFAGKTTELLRTLKRYSIAGINTLVFRHQLDVRWNQKLIQSRDGYKLEAITVKNAQEIWNIIQEKKLNEKFNIIAIDEVQFFDSAIVKIIQKIAKQKYIVICTGLDLDRYGQPFGPMPELLAVADEVIKLKAICTVCGSPATKTYLRPQMNIKQEQKILVGDNDLYEARCNHHFKPCKR